MLRVLFILGTRPEAIKLSPVYLHLQSRPAEFQPLLCVTAQHRHMLDQVLAAFAIEPGYDLDLMRPGQSLAEFAGRSLTAIEPVLAASQPGLVLVQGDTTTTLAGALTAFYHRIPVGHVEAGLRTGDMTQPFPEEMNRVVTSRLAALHFAPTESSARNLAREGVADQAIFVTGNTGIDAVLHVRDGLEHGRLSSVLPPLDPTRKLIAVTAHRRESFGEGFDRICRALARIAARDDVQIVYPVHRNPNVLDPVERHLSGSRNVLLLEPLDYVSFVDLMRRARILLTDSGGIQEEGPSLGKPVLVMREKTERPEGVEAGTVRLTGTDEERIVAETALLLDDATACEAMARVHNPYGDGRASARIADAIAAHFSPGSQ